MAGRQMCADGGLDVADAGVETVVEIDDVEFHRDKTQPLLLGNGNPHGDAIIFNNVPLHDRQPSSLEGQCQACVWRSHTFDM